MSAELHQRALGPLIAGVPMNWMTRWPGAFPVFAAHASGSSITDVDGNTYVDLCLGDTGAMTGHAPPATVAALAEQAARGITMMLPTEDAIWAGEELTRRFGLQRWQIAMTATDANRFVIRMARQVTGRQRVLVMNWCYHGTVDETLWVLDDDGAVVPRPGNVGPLHATGDAVAVVEFNDLEALERELAKGDVALVLTEPALTNIGIVLPDPGYHEALRRLTREHGTLLCIDETHTICVGPGGATADVGPRARPVHHRQADRRRRAHRGLRHDRRAGRAPVRAGVRRALRRLGRRRHAVGQRPRARGDAGHPVDHVAARRTSSGWCRWPRDGPTVWPGSSRDADLPWHVQQLGARAEYWFCPPPRNGGQAAAALDGDLEAYFHLFALNRGVLLTPFHNMALMSPVTTADDVDRHTEVFAECVATLVGAGS